MLFRIKYLLGIMTVLFGLVYVLIGVVGLLSNATASTADRWAPFLLGTIHISLALLLFWASNRERRIEHRRLYRLLQLLLRHQGSLTARDFAELAGVSYAEAQEFLIQASRREKSIVTVTTYNTVRAWSRASMN